MKTRINTILAAIIQDESYLTSNIFKKVKVRKYLVQETRYQI